MRGLGFESQLVEAASAYKRSVSYLSPPIVTTRLGMSYFSPASAFDSLIKLGDESFHSRISQISTLPKQRMSKASTLSELESSLIPMRAAQELLAMSTSPAICSKPTPTDILVLRSNARFSDKSLSYITPLYIDTREFLMVPNLVYGIGLNRLKQRFNLRFGVLGRATELVMGAMGYATMENPTYANFEISRTFGTDNYDPMDSAINFP